MIRRIWHYRSLMLSLLRRDYQLRYRQSLAGLAWAVMPPLATLGAGFLVFNKVAGVTTSGTSYPMSVLAGLIPWTFFASSLTFGVTSVEASKPMLVRMAFPRAVLPLSLVGLSIIDLATTFILFVLFTFATGHSLPVTSFFFPVLLVIEIAFVAGVVLFGSALNVFARDVRLAVPLIVQVWLFATPVLYPLESVPSEIRSWYLLNPMTGLVDSFRRILIFGELPDMALLLPATGGAVVALVLGYWYFASTEHRFADVI